MAGKRLDVYLLGNLTGKLVQAPSGELSFSYAEPYLENGRIALSLSMPLGESEYTGPEVKAYFSGLLPDQELRSRIAAILGVSANNPFALLAEIGGECAGAVSLYPEGSLPPPDPGNPAEKWRALDESALLEILDRLKTRPLLAGEDGIRLSLAGAQNKLAVVCRDSRLFLPLDGQPTSHIIKPMLAEVEESVFNEYFCMRLAKKMGIPTPGVSILWVGDQPCYMVERYDREIDENGSIRRLHQEDFCQALGIPPEFKYEREGGPSLNQCRRLIVTESATPAVDLVGLHRLVIFNYLIGNADAHGKNFALLWTAAKPRLAPAYDLISTDVYPQFSKNMAMKIGGKYNPGRVYPRHWHSFAGSTRTAQRGFKQTLLEMAATISGKAEQLRGQIMEENISSSIVNQIIKTIKRRKEHVFSTME